MPADASETKARILDAAFREFATHGLSGGRVDRIAVAARANKRAIYEYFGNKEVLFDLTVDRVVSQGGREVPQLWDDLPLYAGLIYDYFAADPDRMRIHLWRHLERPQPLVGEQESYDRMTEEMRTAQPAGAGFQPEALFALVWALHFTWFLASPALLPHAAGSRAEHDHRRAVIVEAVRRLTAEGQS